MEKWGFDKENRGVIIFENDLNLKCNKGFK